MINFRDLRADEIECRIAQVSKEGKGLSLLLYKNARCDMNMLDETVGCENWQRSHYECKGNLFCSIGIKSSTSDEWIWKSDCGTESNAEAQKGEASDSFKRAGFNWGIGRELYTAPFIWINATDCNIKQKKDGSYMCKDKFVVSYISIENKKITSLCIVNTTNAKKVFSFGTSQKSSKPTLSDSKLNEIEFLAEKAGVAIAKLEKKYRVKVLSALTKEQAEDCIKGLQGMLNE